MSTTVWVGIYSHRHGVDVGVYTTSDLVYESRSDIAAQFWEEVGERDDNGDPIVPEGVEDIGKYYFDHHESEYFDIRDIPLVGAD